MSPSLKKRAIKRLLMAAAGLLLAGCCALVYAGCEKERGASNSRGPAAGDSYPVRVGGVALRVEVAATPEERQVGLSGRSEVPAGTGMLFVSPEPAKLSFWMKDTQVPLTVAFLDGEGRITQMEEMTPGSEQLHTSLTPVRCALEVPRGWFRQVGVEVGAQVEFSEELRRRYPSCDWPRSRRAGKGEQE